MDFNRINPITGEVATTATAMSPAEAGAVADKAAAAFAGWAQTGPNTRRALLTKAAVVHEARKDEFVKAMMGEIGATAGCALFNLMLAAGILIKAAALTTQITAVESASDKSCCI